MTTYRIITPYLAALTAKREALAAAVLDGRVTVTEAGDFTTYNAPPAMERDIRWVMSERGEVLNHRQDDDDATVTLVFFRLK